MIFDRQNMLDDAATLTETRRSINVLRAKSGVGEPVALKVFCNSTFAAAGAATLNISVITASNEDLSAPTILQDLPAPIPVASLITGFSIEIKVQSEFFQGFIGILYTIENGPMLAGTITSVVTEASQDWKPYERNYITP